MIKVTMEFSNREIENKFTLCTVNILYVIFICTRCELKKKREKGREDTTV